MLTVLHADGSKDLREVHAGIAESRGIQVRIATDGIGCIEQLRQSAPSVLVLDLDLPWGGGEGVLALMRDDPSLCKTPVILTSNGSSLETLSKLIVAPVVWAVAKPFRLSRLLEEFVGAKQLPIGGHRSIHGDREVTDHLKREIQVVTGSRVRDLQVDTDGRTVRVRGQVQSYYVKQLVLVAAMSVLAGTRLEVQLDVDVVSDEVLPPTRLDFHSVS